MKVTTKVICVPVTHCIEVTGTPHIKGYGFHSLNPVVGNSKSSA